MLIKSIGHLVRFSVDVTLVQSAIVTSNGKVDLHHMHACFKKWTPKKLSVQKEAALIKDEPSDIADADLASKDAGVRAQI